MKTILAFVMVLAMVGCGGGGGSTPEATDAGAVTAQPDLAMPQMGMKKPASCMADGECTGKCPMGAKGCGCAPMKICLPTCSMDVDCPKVPGAMLGCSNNFCVLKC